MVCLYMHMYAIDSIDMMLLNNSGINDQKKGSGLAGTALCFTFLLCFDLGCTEAVCVLGTVR